tara:strand:+ start:25692 stop:25901 length:210 start_codon:yes stop_codon:yes gene_type:complete
MATIEELLKSMYTVSNPVKGDFTGRLENNAETWRRIAERDEFAELGFNSDSDKEDFLKQWIEENPYSAT